jgi:hypothetical protein
MLHERGADVTAPGWPAAQTRTRRVQRDRSCEKSQLAGQNRQRLNPLGSPTGVRVPPPLWSHLRHRQQDLPGVGWGSGRSGRPEGAAAPGALGSDEIRDMIRASLAQIAALGPMLAWIIHAAV